jgi:hypothetical protein
LFTCGVIVLLLDKEMALNIANDVIICRWSFSVLTAFELLSILFVLNGLASVASQLFQLPPFSCYLSLQGVHFD